MNSSSLPRIHFIANLWTLVGHPSEAGEWTLEEKIKAISEAEFDGVNDRGCPELKTLLEKYDLGFSGLFDADDPSEFASLITAQMDCGASTINEDKRRFFKKSHRTQSLPRSTYS